MLTQVTINNYAIVDYLDIELDKGMTAITGETGAGKSIMLDALGLTLGDRAERDVIRTGAKRAEITACFAITGNSAVLDWLEAHDFDSEDKDECILRRIVTAEGRSKAYINGQPTSLNELKALGEMLIDIHSQHEHQSLLKASTHQRLLDDYCKLATQAKKISALANQWRALSRELSEIKNSSEDNNAQYQLISYQVKELEELNPGADELAELENEHRKLTHAESSLAVTQQALELCTDSDDSNIQQLLNKTIGLLEDIPYSSKYIEEASTLLNNALIQVEEASAEIARSMDHLEPDPARLEEVDQRMGDLHQMARKHKIAANQLTEHFLALREQLAGMSQTDEKIGELEDALAAILSEYKTEAGKLSTARAKGAVKLEKEINSQLARLGMSNARFSLALNTRTDDTPRVNGFESIEFLVSTNPGQSPKPMIKVASGGELSRISLAIQVVTAQTSAIPTLVFDEVDVGIGGGVAKSVGELLRELGERGQVICVTHQPQVASQGHQHLYVSKSSDKKSTATQLTRLSDKERIEEVARMLGGDTLSDSSLAHAQEMLA